MSSPVGRGAAAAQSIALSLLVFMVLPASQYLGNIAEFSTPAAALARLLLIPAVLAILATLAVLRLTGARDHSRFCSIAAALTLLAWVQAYLLVWDYGPLDGRSIDWDGSTWRGWVDLPLWIGGVVAAAVFHRRLHQPLATAAIVVVALQLGAALASGVARRDALARASAVDAAVDLDAMARFSPTRNVLHVVLDSFQADIFKDLLLEPGGGRVGDALTGFTYFEQNLGTFPYTHLALPALVSGRIYRNHMSKAAFLDEVFAGPTILNAAHDAGFEVDLATDPMMLDLLMHGRHDHAYLIHRASQVEDAARLVDLALFRLAPHALKRHVYADQRWLLQRMVARSPLMQFRAFTHNRFLADLTRRVAADRATPVYKFFHLMGPHAPYVVARDCTFAGRVLERSRESVTDQSRCSLDTLLGLLAKLKDAGIYDSSLIVVMADHGAHVAPRGYQPGSVVKGEYVYDIHAQLVALATPLLAIKPPGAQGPLRTSAALTSSTDLPATLDALLGLGAGLPGRSLFAEAGPDTERRFYGYEWQSSDSTADHVGPIYEYRVTGSAYRVESWHVDGVFRADSPR